MLLNYLVIPLLICLARITDVTIGTLRIMYVSRGMKSLSALLGFVEILIWLFAIHQIMQNLSNYVNIFAYATGYAIGNYAGIWVEGKISLGTLMLRIITKSNGGNLVEYFKTAGYGVTRMHGEGAYGPVDILFTVIRRNNYREIEKIIRQSDPNAVYTVEDVKFASMRPYPLENKGRKGNLPPWLQMSKGLFMLPPLKHNHELDHIVLKGEETAYETNRIN